MGIWLFENPWCCDDNSMIWIYGYCVLGFYVEIDQFYESCCIIDIWYVIFWFGNIHEFDVNEYCCDDYEDERILLW